MSEMRIPLTEKDIEDFGDGCTINLMSPYNTEHNVSLTDEEFDQLLSTRQVSVEADDGAWICVFIPDDL